MRIAYLILILVTIVTIPSQGFGLPGIQSLFDGLSKRILGKDAKKDSAPEATGSRHGRHKRDVADENTGDAHIAESSE